MSTYNLHLSFFLSFLSIPYFRWECCIRNATAFDSVIIACSLESIRPCLVQGCKAPNGVGSACLITSSKSGLPHWTWPVRPLVPPPPRTQTRDFTIGPSQATPSLLIGVVLSPHTYMWGVAVLRSWSIFDWLRLPSIFFTGSGSGSRSYKKEGFQILLNSTPSS